MSTPKYGLPAEVKFCRRCVISNQRPNSTPEYGHTAASKKPTIHFDQEGVCDACRVADDKRNINWDERERELTELCARFRRQDGYDCLVPGSGGKDSFYAAHILRTKYAMHPLLVTWAPHIFTEWGWRNLERWQSVGDHYLHTPDRRTHALLTRIAVERLFHPFQPFIIGQKSFAPKLARQLGIGLVFYGENEAEYGNPRDTASQAKRSATYHSASKIHLSGVGLDELEREYGLTRRDLMPYMPADFSISQGDYEIYGGPEVHYLGYYLRWHPQSAYYYACEHGGFEAAPERTPGTYSKYSSIDDRADDWHYLTTFWKFGIGRATYDAAQEIRSGDIDRDEGVALVRRYDGEWPYRFEDEFNAYLSVPGFPPMTRKRWLELIDKFKSPHLFDSSNRLRSAVWDEKNYSGAKSIEHIPVGYGLPQS